MRRLALFSPALAAFGAIAVIGAQQAAPGTYTVEQATAGRAAYQARCASCHLPDLGGRNEAPPLAGVNFQTAWRARPAAELQDYILKTMPPGGPALGPDEAASITAFILQSNGALGTGGTVGPPTGAPASPLGRGGRGAAGPPPARGLVVEGEV